MSYILVQSVIKAHKRVIKPGQELYRHTHMNFMAMIM